MELVFLISFSLLIASINMWKRHPCHPIPLYIITWSTVIGLWALDSVFSIFEYVTPSAETWTVLGIAHISFILGSFTATMVYNTCARSDKSKYLDGDNLIGKPKISLGLAYGLFLLSFLGYIAFFAKLINVVNFSGSLVSAYRDWNYQVSYGELSLFGGIVGRLYVLPSFAIPYNVYLLTVFPTYKKQLLFISIIEVLFMFSPRRAPLIQTIVVVFFIILLKNRKKIKISWKTITTSIGCLFFFPYTQSLLNKSVESGLVGGIKSIYLYITGNIPAIELQLQNSVPTYGDLVFNVPFKILHKLGVISNEPDLSIPFVSLPVPFNTIPYNYYLIRDFGIVGSTIAIWIIAFVITCLYYKVRASNSFSILYNYSLVLMAIVFSFRENVLITYDAWYYMLLSVIVWIISKRYYYTFFIKSKEV